MNSTTDLQTTPATARNTPAIAVPASAGSRHQQILDEKIASGTRQAAHVMARIMSEAPQDNIVRVDRVRFIGDDRGLHVAFGDHELAPSKHALGQLASRAGIPTDYLRRLIEGRSTKGAEAVEASDGEPAEEEGEWRPELGAYLLKTHYGHQVESRCLARSVGGTLRGWLSDRYRRIDSRPLVEALAAEAQAVGAIPIDGSATETRLALKVILPRVIEPVPGEYMVAGMEWSHSDYGNGGHNARAFGMRVVCLNGMTRENLLREIHLGGKLAEDVVFSDQTYRLDTQRSVSMLRDVVRGALSPAALDRLGDQIRAANATEYTAAALRAKVRTLPKKQAAAVVEAFEGQDVVNLPPGNTAWRASNAISWIARNTDDAEARLDLERLAGSLT